MSERHEYEDLVITTGIPGGEQESSFMNATLQSTGWEPELDFSIACHVAVTQEITTEEELLEYLRPILMSAQLANERGVLSFEVQIGPAGESF